MVVEETMGSRKTFYRRQLRRQSMIFGVDCPGKPFFADAGFSANARRFLIRTTDKEPRPVVAVVVA